ncbi:enediyne antibiotic chromoprotein [Amycolatopsis rubida]|uniref:Neocarzinostatin family protein n=1 Tax=Amycolatopsis rubida TaxID=112413 RepID=A0A1I5SCU0_9PSEU|nr:enediyne antibiotic chromoprotein [Amycolatopsis rubida]SFP68542.1 Neocarzinostatin family protein [Amycolatopsis rubida]
MFRDRQKHLPLPVKAAGLLAAAAAAAVLGSVPASAAGPAVSVAPATGLADGQQVAATGTGFHPDTNAFVGQCATVDSKILCNNDTLTQVKSDSSGTVKQSLAVHTQFTGTDPETGSPVSTVDCTKVSCRIGITQDHQTGASAVISFT